MTKRRFFPYREAVSYLLIIRLFCHQDYIRYLIRAEVLPADYGFKPNTSLRDGLRKFAEWYKEFYL